MTADEGLSQLERIAARIFFEVSIQSAFVLEDPNTRFGIAFKNADARAAGGAKSLEAVAHKIYESDIGSGAMALETNPPGLPALSRVVTKGCSAVKIIDAVLYGLKSAEHLSPVEQRPLELAEGVAVEPNSGNRMVRLVISDNVVADHDVAALFSWHPGSDKGTVLEMAAWPIHKTADLQT